MLHIPWVPIIVAHDPSVDPSPWEFYVGQTVLREVQTRIIAKSDQALGLLMGKVREPEPHSGSPYVIVDRFLPSLESVSEEAGLEEIVRMLRPLQEAASLAGKTVAGWYRGHSRLGLELSDVEVLFHSQRFPESWHFALIGTGGLERPMGAVFAPNAVGEFTPATFHELLEPDSILSGGRKKTVLRWHNYATTDRVVSSDGREIPRPPDALIAQPGKVPASVRAEREAESTESTGGEADRSPGVEDAGSPAETVSGVDAEREGTVFIDEKEKPPAAEVGPGDDPSFSRSEPPVRSPTEPPEPVRDRDREGGPPSWARSARAEELAPVEEEMSTGRGRSEVIPLVLPNSPVVGGFAARYRRVAGRVALVALLAVAGWATRGWWLPEGEGAADAAADAEGIEFAEPAPGGGDEDEGTTGFDASAGLDILPGPAAVTFGALAERVLEAAGTYARVRREFERGTADCRDLAARGTRTAEAFGALRERFEASGGAVGSAAEAAYRRAAAAADRVARHLDASGCPPPD